MPALTPNWTGPFSLATSYNEGDLVSYYSPSIPLFMQSSGTYYSPNVSTWISNVSGNVGNVPGQSSQWLLFAAAGQNGINAWRGAWSSLTSYNAFDAVSYNNASYISRVNANGGNVPDSSPSQWGLLAAAGGSGPAGSFTFSGLWSASVQYEADNIVSYAGSSYAASGTPVLGSPPTTDTPHWQLIAEVGAQGATGPQGPQGAMGLGFAWRGAWSGTTAYHVNDVVSLLGSSWVAVAANTGVNPSTDGGTNWQIMATNGAGAISVFGRTGAVIAESGDYTVAQVTGAAALIGAAFTGPVSVTPAGTAVALTISGDSHSSDIAKFYTASAGFLAAEITAGGNGAFFYGNGSAYSQAGLSVVGSDTAYTDIFHIWTHSAWPSGSPGADFNDVGDGHGGVSMYLSDNLSDYTVIAPGTLVMAPLGGESASLEFYFDHPGLIVSGDSALANPIQQWTLAGPGAVVAQVDPYGEFSITPSGMPAATSKAALTITGDAKGDNLLNLYANGDSGTPDASFGPNIFHPSAGGLTLSMMDSLAGDYTYLLPGALYLGGGGGYGLDVSFDQDSVYFFNTTVIIQGPESDEPNPGPGIPALAISGDGFSHNIINLYPYGSGTPVVEVDASGNLYLSVGLRDSTTSLGESGQLLSSTGSAIKWVAAPGSAILAPSTTGARTAANSVPAGTQYYDLTLSYPLWSDGTVWRDASGAAH